MDDYVLTVYLREAQTQAQFALNALGGLNNVMARLFDRKSRDNPTQAMTLHQEVFRSIHSFLTHASNVSRLFWPEGIDRKKPPEEPAAREQWQARITRGKALRETVGVPARHILRSRKLRNHLDHFDERLDHWSSNSTRRNFIQDTIGPRSAIHIEGGDQGDNMRWFEPETAHFLFRGEEFDLQALANAVSDVLGRTTTALDRIERARFGKQPPPPDTDP